MTVEVHITKENADYYVEAYTIDYDVGEDNVVKEIGKTRLAYVAGVQRLFFRRRGTDNADASAER